MLWPESPRAPLWALHAPWWALWARCGRDRLARARGREPQRVRGLVGERGGGRAAEVELHQQPRLAVADAVAAVLSARATDGLARPPVRADWREL